MTAKLVEPRVLFLTKTYGPDLDRCRLLCRSVDVLAPEVDHLVVVDRADLPQLRRLSGARREVVLVEDLLPGFRRLNAPGRLGVRHNVWLGRRRLVRGWIVQQLVKLAAATHTDADVIVHVDSDTALVRRFTSDVVARNGEVRLYCAPRRIDDRLPKHVKWHRSAERLLGIEPTDLPAADFITSVNSWRRENVSALLSRIERVCETDWPSALASTWDLSEYILYGRFVVDVLGPDAQHYHATEPLALNYWTQRPLAPSELDALLDSMTPEQIGITLTAKAGMTPSSYLGQLECRWREAIELEPPHGG